MLDRDALIEIVIGVAGALILVAFIVIASSNAGSAGNSGGATLIVGGIAAFILFLSVAGYWLSAR
ncbi:MAG: hypothetical protein ABEJ35_03885 [Halobacteriaceae archaeon]